MYKIYMHTRLLVGLCQTRRRHSEGVAEASASRAELRTAGLPARRVLPQEMGQDAAKKSLRIGRQVTTVKPLSTIVLMWPKLILRLLSELRVRRAGGRVAGAG